MPVERLQKILSHAGIASRRKAEILITEGRVVVNGTAVTELGAKADLATDHIKVDGKLIRPPKHLLYIALHKPGGCVTTLDDPQQRETVIDILRRLGVRQRVYPVGRLDYHSEGLLLLTNDGEFANGLTSKASRIPKHYIVKVTGLLTEEQEEQFRTGVPVLGKRTAPAGLRLIRKQENPWYEVRLTEGRNQQIRLMFKHFGLLVEKLRRVRIGFLDLGGLKPGQARALAPAEVARFQNLYRKKAKS
ncbi:MAG: rRNA pseudouridine synthase [Bryobacterales bacterium]|jgi:23S rRNA pseudouridine2605 synthase|nr:rRNA pseudouridine synthase [Bryobacterales bacterium]